LAGRHLQGLGLAPNSQNFNAFARKFAVFWIYSLSQFDLLKTTIDQKEANQTKKKLGTRK